MAHEKSVTRRHPSVPGRAGRWVNVDSVGSDAGTILDSRSYSSKEIAVTAAKKRSKNYKGPHKPKHKAVNLRPSHTRRKKG